MTFSPEIISSHQMEKLLEKGHSGINAQLHVIQEVESPSPIVHIGIHSLLSKYQYIF
jgi:hypothetical protein